MGLLDFGDASATGSGMSLDDPRTQGILAAAAALMNMRRGDTYGNALMAGLQGYAGAQKMRSDQALRVEQLRGAKLQNDQSQMAMDKLKAFQDAYKQSLAGQQPDTSPANAASLTTMPTDPGYLDAISTPPRMPAANAAAPGQGLGGATSGTMLPADLQAAVRAYQASGDPVGAMKLVSDYKATLPKYSPQNILGRGPGGALTQFAVNDQGQAQALPFAPAEKVDWKDTGGQMVPVGEYGGRPAGVLPMPMSMKPGEAQRIAIEQGRLGVERDRFNAEYGTGADGNMQLTAQAIANGQLPPPSGMALTNPRNQRMLAEVMKLNPQYDFTDITAKRKAASDFTSGTLGNQMRAFATAGAHLDQLGQLADALGNGNLQAINTIGNWFQQQTGSPAPTNFDAAKDVVSKEVMKAIVAGGGGQGEREELAKLMNSAKSPAQLKGVIQQYRSLMGAQYDNLLQQRRAAGLSDNTMPNYGGQAASPGGIKFLGFE